MSGLNGGHEGGALQGQPASERVQIPEQDLPKDRRLIDSKAAGELLGVPSTWILQEARHDRIPHVRLGRYVRFSAAVLLDWIDGQERGPRPASGCRPEGPTSRRAVNGDRGLVEGLE